MKAQQTTPSSELLSGLGSSSIEETSISQAKDSSSMEESVAIAELIDKMAELVGCKSFSDNDLDQADKLKSTVHRKLLEFNKRRDVSPEEVHAVALQEIRFGDLSKVIRTHERRILEERKVLCELNRQKSSECLESLKVLLDTHDEITKEVYTRFYALQEEFLSARPLDQHDEATLRKKFTELRDLFYERRAINEELRQYDYRKNLEAKQEIIAELEELSKGTDLIALNRSVQQIISRWHDLGPVSKDFRQDINARFKALTTDIFKRHQAYHDERKKQEVTNLDLKIQLCERVEMLVRELPDSSSKWHEVLESLKSIQEEWRQIGPVSRRESGRVYQRYRQGVDKFFSERKKFKDDLYEQRKSFIEQKEALIREAKLISESGSNDWKAGIQRIKEIQQEWKELNDPEWHNSRKQWLELRKHIDKFFERKEADNLVQYRTYEQNLQEKRIIISQLEALRQEEDLKQLRKRIEEISNQWKSIGRVPSKVKEEVNSAYKSIMDEHYARLRDNREQRRLKGYSNYIERLQSEEGGVAQEVRRLRHAIEKARAMLKNYENNLGFVNANSKSSGGLMKIAERKREQLLQEIALMEEKMTLLRSKL